MCGIVGYLNGRGVPADRALIEQMADVIAHRGPDDRGFYYDDQNGVAFGHRRLSIIDLSAAGHQPMANEDGTIWITFNGEIYNYLELIPELQSLGHRFQSASDTEVIIHAYEQWGVDCLSRFNGMWAFCIWDSRKRTFFAARDRFGEKPFYYWRGQDAILFASEIKAILRSPAYNPRPNDRLIHDYLSFGILDHTDQTFYKGINQLLPGHYMLGFEDDLVIQPYWELNATIDDQISDTEAVAKFRALLEDSIRLRLRSDVPVGSSLSGGLDSSAIVVMASEQLKRASGGRMKTFSCVYPQPEFNERRFAEDVVDRSGAEGYYLEPQVEGLVERIDELLWYQDEPFSTLGVYSQWSVMSLAKRHGVTVLLDGQGSDEILGGYLWFLKYGLSDTLASGNLLEFLSELQAYRTHYPESLLSLWKGIVSPLLPEGIKRLVRGQRPALPELPPGAAPNALLKQMRTSLQLYNLRAYLHYEDRNSMAFSREARLPFLDHRLVEFAYSLPNRMKIRGATTKWLLRTALAEKLSPELLSRRDKMGYATPSSPWLRSTERPAIMAVLDSPSIRERSWFWRTDVQANIRAFVAGESRELSVIWQYVILELWFRRFMDRSEGAVVAFHARRAV